jgi:hypothetical protein
MRGARHRTGVGREKAFKQRAYKYVLISPVLFGNMPDAAKVFWLSWPGVGLANRFSVAGCG